MAGGLKLCLSFPESQLPLLLAAVMCVAALLFVCVFTLSLQLVFINRNSGVRQNKEVCFVCFVYLQDSFFPRDVKFKENVIHLNRRNNTVCKYTRYLRGFLFIVITDKIVTREESGSDDTTVLKVKGTFLSTCLCPSFEFN